MSGLAAWLKQIEAFHPAEIELGLDRIRAVARRMQLSMSPGQRATVLVGGTNGKGSTVAAMELMAIASGKSVFAYTSPHVRNFRERARLNGDWCPESDWLEAFERVDKLRGEVTLTFFEFTTLAAIWIAEKYKPEIAVFEVGLGGRLDAVNILCPTLSILTTVDFDHQDWLGESIAAIAREKVGIARKDRPVLLGDGAVESEIRPGAEAIGARLEVLGKHFSHHSPPPGLHAVHEISWSLAMEAWRQIFGESAMHLAFPTRVMERLLPGRLQVKTLQVTSGKQGVVILDVAHNPASLERLFRWLRNRGKNHRVVCGMMRDKLPPALSEHLRESVKHWHFATLPEPRGERAKALEEKWGVSGACYESVEKALADAWSSLDDHEELVVCGSFVTVEKALKWIDSRTRHDIPGS